MDFKDTNYSVITFYNKFHDTFSKVDAHFNLLDELGGVDFPTAKTIIELLQKYHDTIYCSTDLSKDSLDSFTNLENSLCNAKSLSDYTGIIKTLQRLIHELLIYETRWPGQCVCITIISRILAFYTTVPGIQECEQNDFYTSIRILRELVADCSISIIGLARLSMWDYSTPAYSKLNANDQLVVLLNQAILTDRMYYCLQTLEITLANLNKVINCFDKLDWNVYYAVGFLNFKIHRYNDAIRYFQFVVSNYELKESQDQNIRKRYFHSNLLLAYCYEYDHNFAQAIRTLAAEPEHIVSLLDSHSILSLESNFGEIMESVFKLAASYPTSLISQYFSSFSEFEKGAICPAPENGISLDMQFEILHALAHCLNEYSINNHANRSISSSHNYGKCIRFARLVMKAIAKFRPEYGTCYATIHGECKDYHAALIELDNAQIALSKNKNAKESLVAEISFFRYYFNMLCNRASTADKTIFEQYSEKCDDDDAKCHLKIFEFRDELRRYIFALYECIQVLVGDIPFSEDNIIPIPENLRTKYTELCSLEPTLYMNASVRSELRLMQRAYDCIFYLRTYFIHPTPKNLLVLQNACYRFSTIKQEFHQVSSSFTSQKQSPVSQTSFPSSLPNVVKEVFSAGNASILSSLYSTDSIFILAPISGVVVFQYQTGTIQYLFNSDTILPHTSESEAPTDHVDAIANSILSVYNDMSETIGPREMSNVDWNSLSKFTDIIYHWSNKSPGQVVVCENGKTSYIRQVVDDVAFSKVISKAKKLHDADTTRKYCKDTTVKKRSKTLKCTLQNVMLPWLEIVNEGNSRNFYIAWNDNIENFHGQDTIECFLIPFKTDMAKHVLHTHIRSISIIYQQVSDGDLEPESQDVTNANSSRSSSPSALTAMADQISRTSNAKRAQIKDRWNKLQSQLSAYDEHSTNPNLAPIIVARDKCSSQILDLDRIIKYVEKDPAELSLAKLQQCQEYLQSL